jgi:MYXO-CTERM domain-containing protein
MKKLALTLALGFLLTPVSAFAHHDRDWDDDDDRISATEMGTIGFTAAGLIGVAGYLVLRRRRAASSQS